MRYQATVQGMLFTSFVVAVGILATSRVIPLKSSIDGNVLRGTAAKSFESLYDGVIPAKTFGINLWAAIDRVVFREGKPGVVIGRKDWLYTDEEFKLDNNYESVIRHNLALMPWVRGELARRGVALVVAVVPAKARIYPEYLADRRPPDTHRRLYGRILAQLKADGITAVDLARPLTSGKGRQATFLRTDTHWTPWGAELAAESIADAVRAAGLGAPASEQTQFVTHVEPSQAYRGDLFSFLPLDPYFKWLLPPEERIAVLRTEPEQSADANQEVPSGDLFGSGAAPHVALVGTSYSANPSWNFLGSLEQAMHETVLNYAREGVGPFIPVLDYLRGEDLRKAPPRVVIWEVPERYMAQAQELGAYQLPIGVDAH